MRKVKFLLVVILFVAAMQGSAVQAATPAQIEQAVANGLAWLATQQNPDGSFGNYVPVAETGLAVWAFCQRAIHLNVDPLSAAFPYKNQVQNGLNYLFAQAQTTPLANPDGNGDGLAVVWNLGTPYETYSTGIAMAAIASSQNPGAIVNVAASPVNGWTYQKVLQDGVDWLVNAQGAAGCNEGGWAYYTPFAFPWADQSNSGYASFGLKLAHDAAPYGFRLTIPQATLNHLNVYITHVQDAGGGSIYEPCTPYSWINILKTGHLINQMILVGDTKTTARVQNAIAYIESQWNNTGPNAGYSETSQGWKDDYQAMFTMMKGLVSAGVDTLTVGGNPIDWFDQVSTQIVTTQNVNGSWPLTIYEGGDESQILTTAWALLTSMKSAGAPPQVVPAFSGWGLIIFSCLLIASVIVFNSKRRRA